MQNITLITGSARSGKTKYALSLGANTKKPFYIATGWPGDKEMTERIAKHRSERDRRWNTIETKTELIDAICEAKHQNADYILIDCITLWISNLLMENKNPEKEIDALIISLPYSPSLTFVTNEVGWGIVPNNKISREFRDAAGIVNKKLAETANTVVLMVCGIPVKIKPQNIQQST